MPDFFKNSGVFRNFSGFQNFFRVNFSRHFHHKRPLDGMDPPTGIHQIIFAPADIPPIYSADPDNSQNLSRVSDPSRVVDLSQVSDPSRVKYPA